MRRRPYPDVHRTRRITIRVDEATLWYFGELSYETNVPYQTLINHYLRHCIEQGLTLDVSQCRTKHRANDEPVPE
jgi:hypothetical protein